MLMMKRILATMEQEELCVVPEQTEETILASNDDSRIQAADAVAGEVAEVLDAVQALEDFAELVQHSHASGGMSQDTALAVNLGLEHVYSSLGAYRNGVKGLSLESFEKDPKHATQVVLESIGERVEAVWKSLVEMIKRLVRWVQDFLGDVLSTANFLANRAKKLGGEINAMGSDADKTPKADVTDEVLCRRLYSPDIRAADVVPEFHRLAGATVLSQFKLSEETYRDMMAIADSLQRSKLKFQAKDVKGDAAGPDLKKATMDVVKKVGTILFDNRNDAKDGVPAAPAGVNVYSTPAFLGGLGWYAFLPKEFDSIADLKLGTYRLDGGQYEGLPVLTRVEMRNVLNSVEGVNKLQKLGSKQLSHLKNLQRMLEMVVDGYANTSWVSALPDEVVKVRRDAMRALLRIVTSQGMSGMSHYIRVARDMLRMVEQSMAAYPRAPKSDSTALVVA